MAALDAAYWAKAMALADVYDAMTQKRREEWSVTTELAFRQAVRASPLAHRGRSRVAVLPGQETVDGRLRHATALFERVSVLVSQCHQGFQ